MPALCEALQVSRSGYYAARQRGPSARLQRQVDLTARIKTIHQASRESYGAPRVHVELLAQQVPCCRNTVAKLMRRAEILPKAIRRFLLPDLPLRQWVRGRVARTARGRSDGRG